MWHIRIATTIIAGVVGLALSGHAAACCPDIGHKPATTGLGKSAPEAANLSAVPDLRIYEFMRDGIRYLQINDAAGGVRAAIGRIDGTAWVMPIGADADRVSILQSTGAVQGNKVFEAAELAVYLQQTAEGEAWVVVAKE